MKSLDAHYLSLLQMGLLTLRHTTKTCDHIWTRLEVEFLHNVPTLVGETNVTRHLYFWQNEREMYLERLSAISNTEAKLRMVRFYEPIFREMQPIIDDLIAKQKSE
jgi:hypothetical protein